MYVHVCMYALGGHNIFRLDKCLSEFGVRG